MCGFRTVGLGRVGRVIGTVRRGVDIIRYDTSAVQNVESCTYLSLRPLQRRVIR